MGIIRAAVKSISSGLADQWLEVIEPADMGAQTLMTPGVLMNKKSQNRKGSRNVISDGSVIHVYDNQFMILTDGGKIIDYTAEPGYFEVKNNMEPSLFNGDFSSAMESTFERIKYGGQSPTEQKVYYLNLQEIKKNTPHILRLHVVEQIAAAHGGRSAFKLNYPSGARTCVWLPLG